jgi:hypothetical protein
MPGSMYPASYSIVQRILRFNTSYMLRYNCIVRRTLNYRVHRYKCIVRRILNYRVHNIAIKTGKDCPEDPQKAIILVCPEDPEVACCNV